MFKAYTEPCPNPECKAGSNDHILLNISSEDYDNGCAIECRNCFMYGPVAMSGLEAEKTREAARLWNGLPR